MSQQTHISAQHFLPDFCRIDAALYIMLMAELLAIVLAINTHLLTGEFWVPLALNGIFILWISLISAALLCISKQQTAQWKPLATALFAFAIINLNTILLTWIVIDLFPRFEWLPVSTANNPYLNNLFISGIVSSIILRYLYVLHEWKIKTKAESNAKLDALQARMRPHFLFNSLNTIASLTQENPALAETLTEDLSELFRASMQASGRMVRLEQECELTRQYLNIEQTRLGERLQVDWQIDEAPSDALIPPLSLQPLVENAVHHGIEPLYEKSTLLIKGSFDNKIITLSIQNPLAESEPNRDGNRIAIENLRLRLQNCFPNQSSLTLSSGDNYFLTQVRFPYKTSQS
jgi:two-component system sensor histidine kinase AlgZ